MLSFPKNLKEEKYLGKISSELLYIDKSGWKARKPQPEYTHRLNGRCDWQIIYISNGYGYFYFDEKLTKVGPYSLVIFKPYEPQLYYYLPKDCPVANYIHFSGTAAETLIKKYQLDTSIFYNTNPAYDAEILNLFLKFHTSLKKESEHYSWGLFLDILAELSKSIYQIKNTNHNFQSIANILELMHNETQNNYSVEHYAKLANLSVSRFAHIFKEVTGFSPIQYQNNLKIQEAKSLLLKTDVSVEYIADILGYSSIAHFSKQFKANTNLSPLNYRKHHLKQ